MNSRCGCDRGRDKLVSNSSSWTHPLWTLVTSTFQVKAQANSTPRPRSHRAASAFRQSRPPRVAGRKAPPFLLRSLPPVPHQNLPTEAPQNAKVDVTVSVSSSSPTRPLHLPPAFLLDDAAAAGSRVAVAHSS